MLHFQTQNLYLKIMVLVWLVPIKLTSLKTSLLDGKLLILVVLLDLLQPLVHFNCAH